MLEVDGVPVARRPVVILNPLGLHLRPADLFVGTARRFEAEVRVHLDGRAVDGKSILDLATLAAGCGTRLELEARGPDAEAALAALAELVAARFHDGDGAACPAAGMTPPRARPPRDLVALVARILSERDADPLMRAAAEGARDLIGARGAAMSVGGNPRHNRLIVVASTAEDPPRDWGPLDGDGLLPFATLDATDRPARLTRAELDADPRSRPSRLVGEGRPTPNGWLVVPLVDRDGKGIGLLQLWDKVEGEFTEDDEAVLVQLARLAAVAIANARADQELRGEAERKDEFLAMLSHELRNPLAAIGNAVRLAERSDAGEDLAWSLGVISRQQRHLSRLIDDLLDVSRIARGKIRLRRDTLEVTPILESAAATVAALVEERNHTLELDLDRGTLWAKVDPTRLEQVVVNLLTNAAKYSEDGGHIRLSGRVEAGQLVVRVKDGGFGIPPEQLSELFELFAQGDNSPGRSEGGLGVGLAVVKRLVELHGGTIDAASEGPGRGSEFVVRLPAATGPVEVRPPSAGPSRAAHPGARVLVVDDNADAARSLERLLRLAGHDVTVAHDGDEALGAARETRPEFVLLDIGLPGMDGHEVASRLRREGCCEGAILVAVSGYGQDEDRRRSREVGIDHHLVKPLDHDALLALISAGAGGDRSASGPGGD
ncbi:hybrid sensor histidine kinase/response regulator [Tautonia plasticadhaerens]|uniref:histidine kinase n=1 Tax=Tautonia plasticadhaerens TaxID=2527974 RepID=A0A518H2H7_9BACT|nr:HPr family phosphocarrier protein [Tautonia plasticadhaerens]QDV35035.1 Autoinducer 2 sensor kinase/phosphatase LuxQ [Tautonia plasticadhaerens]